MSCGNIDEVRGIGGELQALSNRLRALTAGNPAIHCDQFILARGQINSAIRYLEMGVLKAGPPNGAGGGRSGGGRARSR